MKKSLLKFTGTFLAVVMLFSFVGVPVSASFAMTEAEWESHWSNLDRASVHLSPGSNPSEMNFAWFDDETAEPVVSIRAEGEADYVYFVGTSSAVEGDASYTCKVTVSGLLPETTYEYICISDGYTSPVNTFTTGAEDEFTAVLVSDVHVSQKSDLPDEISNSAMAFNNILAEASAKAPETSLLISAGDMADHGLYNEYVGVFANQFVKNVPLASVCGNHDYKESVFPTVMNYPNTFNSQAISPDKCGGDYWFVKGDVLFLMLNSNWISATDHRTFVERAVKMNPDVKWRVAVMHHDLYGGHIESRESENVLLRAMFVPIFDEFSVDLVLMGHSHVYSRSHVLYDQKIVENLKGDNSVTDAEGTIYLTTGSTRRPREVDLPGSTRVAFDYRNTAEYIFDVIDFSEDSIEITAYASGAEEPVDNFTIYKTDAQGGHSGDDVTITYDLVYFISLIASIIVNIGQLLGL